jgi:hypothetical protein
MAIDTTSDISQVIQLAVAPVFLLAGIGAFINAFAMRLGRIFDRSRLLEGEFATCESGKRSAIQTELLALRRRAKAAYIGIALDILAALLICLEHFFGFEIRGVIGGLFIAAMLSLIGGLIAFLREVFIAVRSLAMGLPSPVAGQGNTADAKDQPL